MSRPLNLRYELRAYETTDACRLASILQELAAGDRAVSRDKIAARWAERYPQHAEQAGSRNIRSRIRKALTLLNVAAMTQTRDSNIEIYHSERLGMAARNLAIVENSEGIAIPPSSWARRPEAPQHLLAIQAPIEQQRLEAVKNRAKSQP